MSSIQNGIDTLAHYRESHEWIRPAAGNTWECGISKHAEAALGDVVFVELPKIGTKLKAGDVFGTIESVKAASDLYMPVDGTIVAVNDTTVSNPALVNQDCYGEGWLIRLAAEDSSQIKKLLTATAYAELILGAS